MFTSRLEGPRVHPLKLKCSKLTVKDLKLSFLDSLGFQTLGKILISNVGEKNINPCYWLKSTGFLLYKGGVLDISELTDQI